MVKDIDLSNPMDKGLIGYRLFLTCKDDQPAFYAVRTLEELRKLSVVRVWDGRMSKCEDPLFLKYHGDALKRHHLKNRKIFRIKNPLLTPETPLNDQQLGYDPYKD
jgi:hypothetical protein